MQPMAQREKLFLKISRRLNSLIGHLLLFRAASGRSVRSISKLNVLGVHSRECSIQRERSWVIWFRGKRVFSFIFLCFSRLSRLLFFFRDTIFSPYRSPQVWRFEVGRFQRHRLVSPAGTHEKAIDLRIAKPGGELSLIDHGDREQTEKKSSIRFTFPFLATRLDEYRSPASRSTCQRLLGRYPCLRSYTRRLRAHSHANERARARTQARDVRTRVLLVLRKVCRL